MNIPPLMQTMQELNMHLQLLLREVNQLTAKELIALTKLLTLLESQGLGKLPLAMTLRQLQKALKDSENNASLDIQLPTSTLYRTSTNNPVSEPVKRLLLELIDLRKARMPRRKRTVEVEVEIN